MPLRGVELALRAGDFGRRETVQDRPVRLLGCASIEASEGARRAGLSEIGVDHLCSVLGWVWSGLDWFEQKSKVSRFEFSDFWDRSNVPTLPCLIVRFQL